MNINIGVCDDSEELLGKISADIEEAFAKNGIKINVDKFSNGEALVALLGTKNYDILFLDIRLPGISGFEVADKVRAKGNDSCIVFITSENECVYESFNYNPFYFVRKDMYNMQMPTLILKLINHIKQNDIIIIGDASGQEQICIKEIMYMMSEGHYIYIFTKQKEYKMRKNISELELLFTGLDFIRSHKKYLINLRYLKRVDIITDEVILKNDIRLPMSRTNRTMVKEAQKQYIRAIV